LQCFDALLEGVIPFIIDKVRIIFLYSPSSCFLSEKI
jgi:hypothetical protein